MDRLVSHIDIEVPSVFVLIRKNAVKTELDADQDLKHAFHDFLWIDPDLLSQILNHCLSKLENHQGKCTQCCENRTETNVYAYENCDFFHLF